MVYGQEKSQIDCFNLSLKKRQHFLLLRFSTSKLASRCTHRFVASNEFRLKSCFFKFCKRVYGILTTLRCTFLSFSWGPPPLIEAILDLKKFGWSFHVSTLETRLRQCPFSPFETSNNKNISHSRNYVLLIPGLKKHFLFEHDLRVINFFSAF